MQYLLTKEEYDKIAADQLARSEQHRAALQDLCTKVADHMPVKWGWTANEDAKPWGCILTQKGEWYCDSCPVKDVCPYPRKEWSK